MDKGTFSKNLKEDLKAEHLYYHTSPFMPHDPSQVYKPDADTYLLLDAARAEVKAGDRVLEIGTGSGLIAAELAKVTGVVATDINPHAVLCARKRGVDVVRSDLFCGIRSTFDLIVFNPPYLPTQPEEMIDDWLEHALNGGLNGRTVIRAVLRRYREGACTGREDFIVNLFTHRAAGSTGPFF